MDSSVRAIPTREYRYILRKFYVSGQTVRVMALEHINNEYLLDLLKAEFSLPVDNDYRTITNPMPKWILESGGEEFL